MPVINRWIYFGLFCITMSTLMYEVVLTRIFSATMWYHFAFVAISLTMFGMSSGALLVYLKPKLFPVSLTTKHLCSYSILLSISYVLSAILYFLIPIDQTFNNYGFAHLVSVYTLFSIPFILSGIVVCLALTRFSKVVGKLYAADLIGAASGAILVVAVLSVLDAPSSTGFIAMVSGIGATLFSVARNGILKQKIFCAGLSLLLLCFALTNNYLFNNHYPCLRPGWLKGKANTKVFYEKWNAFSYVRVGSMRPEAFGWGLSTKTPKSISIPQMFLTIDGLAASPMTKFNGDFKSVEYLKYDITNFAHHLRPCSDVLIIGVGGGRDILSSLLFNQKSTTAVEVNDIIFSLLKNRFADFTGHLAEKPGVTIVNDEARSFLSRSPQKFDIIQASLTDTWTATSAGAFTLTENGLYTTEAWHIFLSHLKNNGLITFSRWHKLLEPPLETYRLFNLACAALKNSGVQNPEKNIILLVIPINYKVGVSTILVSKKPFSESDVDKAEQYAQSMQFKILYSPKHADNLNFYHLIYNTNFFQNFPANISAPTDDCPFFFNTINFGQIFKQSYGSAKYDECFANRQAVAILAYLLAIVFVLSAISIIFPWYFQKNSLTKSVVIQLGYFGLVGVGFMLVEIAQMQRLSVFLGRPTYGLSVVLSTLLLAGGIGSYLTSKFVNSDFSKQGRFCLALLILTLLLTNWMTPILLTTFEGSSLAEHIIIAIVLLVPVGILLGMAFPIGIRWQNLQNENISAWLWATNGAGSVLASVLAIVISLAFSIHITFAVGIFCYVLALLSFGHFSSKTN